MNPSMWAHVNFIFRRQDCAQIKINNICILVENKYKYLGVCLDRRLTWHRRIEDKLAAIEMKSTQMDWIIGPHSTLDLGIYKRPIWS